MAMSGIQMIGSAFQEGNTPLETTITLLSGLGMVLPVITTAYKALTSATAASQLGNFTDSDRHRQRENARCLRYNRF